MKFLGKLRKPNITNVTSLIYSVAGVMLLIGVTIGFGQVIARYIFRTGVDITIDLVIWFVVWAALLASGPVLYEGGQVNVDFILLKFKGTRRFVIDMINFLPLFIYSGLLIYGGVWMVYSDYVKHMVWTRFIHFPQWPPKIAIPLGMSLMLYYAILWARKTVADYRRQGKDYSGNYIPITELPEKSKC